jgi:hypothetical protein
MMYFKVLGDPGKAVLRVFDSDKGKPQDFDLSNEQAIFLLHSLVDMIWRYRDITNRE